MSTVRCPMSDVCRKGKRALKGTKEHLFEKSIELNWKVKGWVDYTPLNLLSYALDKHIQSLKNTREEVLTWLVS